jgi:hypothetical protein
MQESARNTLCPCVESYRIPDTLDRVAVFYEKLKYKSKPLSEILVININIM